MWDEARLGSTHVCFSVRVNKSNSKERYKLHTYTRVLCQTDCISHQKLKCIMVCIIDQIGCLYLSGNRTGDSICLHCPMIKMDAACSNCAHV